MAPSEGEPKQSGGMAPARLGVMTEPSTFGRAPLCAVCGHDAAVHLGFTRIITCGQFHAQADMPNISAHEEGTKNA